MAFIPVLDTVEAEMIMELFGQRIENTLYFHKDGGFTPADMVNLGESLQVWWGAQYNSIVTEDLALVDVIVTDLTSDTAPSIAVPAPPGTIGLVAPPTAPGSVCATISFRTAGRGRSSRGRNYISGIAEASIVGNDFTGTYAGFLVDVYDYLLVPANLPGDVEWVVVSRYHDNAPRLAGITQLITSVIVTDTAVDSQRRRLRGRGD